MVGILAHSTINGIIAGSKLARLAKSLSVHLLRAITRTAFACFDITREALAPTQFDNDELPSLVQNLFDDFWNINHFTSCYYVVVTMNVPIVHLIVVKGVFFLAVSL